MQTEAELTHELLNKIKNVVYLNTCFSVLFRKYPKEIEKCVGPQSSTGGGECGSSEQYGGW